MKTTLQSILFVVILVVVASSSNAQSRTDACGLITTGQINKLIGCVVNEGAASMGGKHCAHVSADNKVKITTEYYDWRKSETTLNMLKMAYDENSKNISAGKKAVGVYSTIKAFVAGGPNAMIMTGEGDAFTNGNVVRIQFVIGTSTFTFDTQGIDKNKVVAKAEEIYNAVKGNYK